MKIVAALGGNAIVRYREKGTAEEQLGHIDAAVAPLARMAAAGHAVMITHGNGPQVGDILLQNECARDAVPRMPLDVCGAESQGMIGYMIQQCMQNRLGPGAQVATVLSRTLVDPGDPAFATPSKAIGPYYSDAEARALAAAEGWAMREEEGRGWRRIVPSPDPLEVLEIETIGRLFDAGTVVVAGGGGGVPVVRQGGLLRGVEAVVDKDLAAERIAVGIGADLLLMLTDVQGVFSGFGTPARTLLNSLDAATARRLLAEGEFGEGSMAPKVLAAIRFVGSGAKTAIIAHLDDAEAALDGEAGTLFTA
ncbi:carbamate kinase [Methanofollis liminatans DSM 4140]|jgi:carbamate kinase|uniref:Carbamate kinase n=1 Tax=Methanofollis liminatans DSM 4140 TaxID=28892 RepID=J1L2Y5_9EURY|nr:carbamate kinase [Methanofollis liminatans]EJG07432.1 carbamate kinase [Methanofollis liminatans DSM 4140]